MPAVPLDEAASLEGVGGGGGGSTLKEIVMTVLRNPMYLFALIYFIKYVGRTYLAPLSAKYTGGSQGVEEDPFGNAAVVTSKDAGESEF